MLKYKRKLHTEVLNTLSLANTIGCIKLREKRWIRHVRSKKLIKALNLKTEKLYLVDLRVDEIKDSGFRNGQKISWPVICTSTRRTRSSSLPLTKSFLFQLI
jgi:hypothetical protein